MILHRTIPAKRLLALLASVCMATAMGACSPNGDSQSQQQPSSQSSATADAGNVAIFAPTDSITISQQTPLSKWEKLVPEIVSSLKRTGVKSGDITVKTASNLDKQSQSVQDYVVNHINGTEHSSTKAKTTLVVAPVAEMPESDRQYGDYARHDITWNSDASDEDEQDYAQSAQRLVSALQLAQNEGMKVVLISNTLQGYAPDVYVPMTTAEQIGQLQAKQLVSKLELDKTSSDNPKHIEVLLPYDAANESGSTADATFAQGVFKGIWSVLGPYFKDGKAVSPSGTLTSSSTESDWVSVAFDAAKSERVKSTLAGRLGMDKDTSRHTRIDGIISCNDYVAGYASEELNDLGYTGSAADINPSITISGIVDNITGKKDLKKQSVPDPAQAPESDDGDSDTEDTSDSLDEQNSQWPIITGYGAYVSSIPNIVNGKQWMTALENRKTLASDIAQTCVQLNTSGKLAKLTFISSVAMEDMKVPTIQEEALAVSASNLKKTLIEPGYISLAEAGL